MLTGATILPQYGGLNRGSGSLAEAAKRGGAELDTRKALALEVNERWFLVHTQPKSERKAQMHLGAQGFRTHFPQIQKTIRHARQLRTVRAPLFPRYMFLILDPGRDRWLSVRSTVGVSSLITCQDRPVPVPEGIVEALIARSDEANLTLFGSGLTLGANSSDNVGTVCRFRGHARAARRGWARARFARDDGVRGTCRRCTDPCFPRPHDRRRAKGRRDMAPERL